MFAGGESAVHLPCASAEEGRGGGGPIGPAEGLRGGGGPIGLGAYGAGFSGTYSGAAPGL